MSATLMQLLESHDSKQMGVRHAVALRMMEVAVPVGSDG